MKIEKGAYAKAVESYADIRDDLVRHQDEEKIKAKAVHHIDTSAAALREAFFDGNKERIEELADRQRAVLIASLTTIFAMRMSSGVAADLIDKLAKGEDPTDAKEYKRLALMIREQKYDAAWSFFSGMDTFLREAVPEVVTDWLMMNKEE